MLTLVASVALAHSALQDEDDDVKIVDPVTNSHPEEIVERNSNNNLASDDFLQMPSDAPKKDF